MRNIPLAHIKAMPQNNVTRLLITAVPSLVRELYSEAKGWAKELGSGKPLLADCVLDLELVGGFGVVADFAKDAELASIYTDALVFAATGKPVNRVPDERDYRELGTEKYRGIAKYAASGKYFNVGDPEGWLFGKEYARIVNGDADLAHIIAVTPTTLRIRKLGAWIVEHALTGKIPSEEERAALSALEAEAYKRLHKAFEPPN